MVEQPKKLYTAKTKPEDVLLSLRELLNNNPVAAAFGPEVLAELLYAERYLERCPTAFEVEAGLEVLEVEGLS